MAHTNRTQIWAIKKVSNGQYWTGNNWGSFNGKLEYVAPDEALTALVGVCESEGPGNYYVIEEYTKTF